MGSVAAMVTVQDMAPARRRRSMVGGQTRRAAQPCLPIGTPLAPRLELLEAAMMDRKH